jgi:carotenoid cleavage dioxygenase-like enzyme
VEFPTIDYRRNGREHRYVYCAETRHDGPLPSHLAKVDTERGPGYADRWSAPDCYPGEPVFVPAAREGQEDDGVVLSLVLDTDADCTFLLVLDAGSFRELARARLPHRLPFAFHGEFYGPTTPGRSVQ